MSPFGVRPTRSNANYKLNIIEGVRERTGRSTHVAVDVRKDDVKRDVGGKYNSDGAYAKLSRKSSI